MYNFLFQISAADLLKKPEQMSQQYFTAIQRQAIWLAYSRKCAYSGELLDIRNMHIDHILPEKLANDSAEAARVRKEFCLPDDFDFLGYENLVPSTQAYNQLKKDIEFDTGRINFFLGIARSRKTKVEENAITLENQLEQNKALILLHQALEAGKITPEQMTEIIEKHQGKPESVFKIIEGLGFINSDDIFTVRKTDIADLRKRPIKFQRNPDIEGVELYKDDETIIVRTCEEYERARTEGYYARTTFAIKMAANFEHQCGLLKALERASIASESYIENPKVGITDLDLLPIGFFPRFPDGDSPFSPDSKSYQDEVERGGLVVKGLKRNWLRIQQPEGMGHVLVEAARADFNGDGIEDILLFEYCYATHGTMGVGFVGIITRKSFDSMFESVK